MNGPATTLTSDELEERAAIAFLERYVADRAARRTPPLADYLAAFPRFEARIAREWLMLTGGWPTVVAETAAPRTDHVGPYRLEREVGRGSQGVVYLAEDTRLGRRVALKVLAHDVAALSGPAALRLQREAEAIARLDHPGIATVYESGRSEGVQWFAMRYVGGGSVQHAIAARIAAGEGPPRGRHDVAAAVRLVERAARALDAAHRAGILHRDIKPANLLLAAPDEPVLVDFGLAADAAARTPTVTVPGAVFGTLAYLAPERLAGAAADARSDVYSLGAVLFELLTLRRPYAEAVTAQEVHAIAVAPAPDVRTHNADVPRDLAIVVAAALAKAPADRYSSAAAFADDLARFLARQPIAARPASARVRLVRWAQRQPALAGSLAALAAAVVTGLAVTTCAWRRTASALDDVQRLADLKLARELAVRAGALWPARPERLPALRAWRDDLNRLQERVPDHRRRLAELSPPGTDTVADWEREQLTALLGVHDELDGARRSVETRIATATTLAARTLDEPRAEWDAAVARVAASPHYGGLRLAPQLGLVPLGPDPESGLEEFAHVLSGSAPSRDASTGRLHVDEDSGVVLVLVPGGRSVLGAERSPPADGRSANVDPEVPPEQTPSYVVELEPFLLSRFELTQAQWQRHTGRNPSSYAPGGALTNIRSALHPVELVSWNDCERVLRELDLCLPTEAQWEHAYRAGTNTPYPYGADERSVGGHENLADKTAREQGSNRRLRFVDWLDDGWLVHAPAGSFGPNRWGFHDMGGNVKEWCDDSWEDYPAVVPRAGDGLRRGAFDAYRIVRGGCFASYVDDTRAAARGGVQRDVGGAEAGVRPARRLAR